MKFISWNVNGLRACVGKDFENQFKELDADFFCLQETKMQEGQLDPWSCGILIDLFLSLLPLAFCGRMQLARG